MSPIRARAAALLVIGLTMATLLGRAWEQTDDNRGGHPDSAGCWTSDKRQPVLVERDDGRWGAVCGRESWRLAMAAEHLDLGDCPLPALFDADALLSGTRIRVIGEGPRCRAEIDRLPTRRRLALGLPLPVNLAEAADLERLPGIGKTLAHRIVAFRAAHGPFQATDDLRAVRGIGQATIRRIDRLVTLD